MQGLKTGLVWVIFLEINRFVCLWSFIARYGKKRSDLPGYLSEDSLLKDISEICSGIWAYPKKGRKFLADFQEKYPDKPFIRIKSRREVNRIMKDWEAVK